MARWIVLIALVVSSTAMARKVVIMDPPMVRACPSAPSWEGIDKCLRKHGTPTIIRSLPTAHLVQLQQKSGDTSYDGGVFLYVQQGKEWKLAGIVSNRGTEYDILGFVTVKVGTHVGYRVDVGSVYRMAVQPDGFTTALAMSALLVVVSGALLVALRVILQWQPSRPTSRFLFAPSR